MIIKVMVCKFTIIFVWKQKIYIFATEKRLKTIKKYLLLLLATTTSLWALAVENSNLEEIRG